MYAIAFQMQCKCNAIASLLKVTIVTTIKKGLPGKPHIAHYKKRSRERHETKNKRLANFLAKQMKNTQTSHDIKKGAFHICWWKKMEAYKKGNISPKSRVCVAICSEFARQQNKNG